MERSRTPCSPLRRALSTVMLAAGSGLLVAGLVVRVGLDRAVTLAKMWEDLPAEAEERAGTRGAAPGPRQGTRSPGPREGEGPGNPPEITPDLVRATAEESQRLGQEYARRTASLRRLELVRWNHPARKRSP